MDKLIAGIIAVAVLGAGTMFATSQDQHQTFDQKPAPFMQRKLDRSRDIVSGLAMENYDLIEGNAQRLSLLSHEADWNIVTTSEYQKLSRDFRGAASRLSDNANKKSIDGCTLAYFEVTLSCVRCHQYVRSNRADQE